MADSRYYAGVDIGGTGIKAAIVDEAGEPVVQAEIPTSLDGFHAVCLQIAQLVDSMLERSGLDRDLLLGVGLGVPGYVDPKRGFVHESPNLGWRDVPLKDRIGELTGLPTEVENDANAAAFGEQWRGAGRGVQDMAMITLGTGVGCGIIAGGRIVHGTSGFAGEIGHMKVKPKSGEPCVCGKTGCLETTSSGLAILKAARAAMTRQSGSVLHRLAGASGKLTVKTVFDAAKDGDRAAEEAIGEAGFYLGVALANFANLLNPGKIVIGGGISAAADYFIPLIRESFNAFALDIVRENTAIVTARLGNAAGFTGSARLIKERS
ncbi:ROK family glucokinase [Paenibacillaceae bacterium WGS1546]|uniref:ROK family glucokinase n=1 Tax=Cohnella sp. WGS1546 TaxID=3366810 RepID=UPI00372D1991